MPVIAVAWPKFDYLSALENAGATPRVIGPDTDPLPAALEGADGVLLTGGADVDPAHYNDDERHETLDLDPVRDAYELAIARAALERDLPLLAICRGVQVLNVAAGGTLVQDIPSADPTALAHSIVEPRDQPSHDVIVGPDTCLGAVLAERLGPDRRLAVNSRHHQSVKQVAPGFVVSAVAPDGVIEAIERPASRWCIGVQWHPENFWRSGRFSPLFDALVAAAKKPSGRFLRKS